MDTEATAVISGVGEAWGFSISNKLIPTLPHRVAVLASSRALAATTVLQMSQYRTLDVL